MTSEPLFTAHDVGDLLNALPTCFGFTPTDSLCAIATHGRRRRLGFRLRVDLPTDPDHLVEIGRFVASHLRNQGADGAIVLAVSSRTDDAGRAVAAVERALGPVQPVVMAWADGSRWWSTDPLDPAEGVPYVQDPHHPAVTAAVVAGQEVLPDRAALEARWAPLSGPARAWLERQLPLVECDVVTETLALSAHELGETGWDESLAVLEDAARGPVTDAALLRLAVWLTHQAVRDRLWPWLDAVDERRWLPVWRDVARRCPGFYAAVPYTVAAYLAYLRGEGAQAAIALEQALRADPGYSMAQTLTDVLQRGTHPSRVRALVRCAVGRPRLLAPARGRSW